LTKPDAAAIAMRLLARREHAFAELVRKLTLRGVDERDARKTVSYLRDQGLQSEQRYAGVIVRTRSEAGYGMQRIRAELRHQGVAECICEAALQEHAIDWVSVARDRIRRRYARDGLDSARNRSRVLRHLQQRGFSNEQARQALESAWDEGCD